MAKKLTNFEIKLLIEYRMFQDIKNQADKKCKQLQKQVYELIQNKKLTEKENYIFNHNNNVFSVSEHTRTLTDMQQVRDFFVKKKVDMPVKQSTYYSIKNVTNNKEQESLIEEQYNLDLKMDTDSAKEKLENIVLFRKPKGTVH